MPEGRGWEGELEADMGGLELGLSLFISGT